MRLEICEWDTPLKLMEQTGTKIKKKFKTFISMLHCDGALSVFLLIVLLGFLWGQNDHSFQPTQEESVLGKEPNFVSRSNSATEDKKKWVRNQRSIVLARASQMERYIDVVRTVPVCPGNSECSDSSFVPSDIGRVDSGERVSPSVGISQH
ncbi:UNVERIFIED_CONTAM: hypothetical protein NCL1_21754 [Trichonephila clavipes]